MGYYNLILRSASQRTNLGYDTLRRSDGTWPVVGAHARDLVPGKTVIRPSVRPPRSDADQLPTAYIEWLYIVHVTLISYVWTATHLETALRPVSSRSRRRSERSPNHRFTMSVGHIHTVPCLRLSRTTCSLWFH